MTVPTKAKVWNLIAKSIYDSNVDIGNRKTLFEIKDALVTGTGAWEVIASSDKNTCKNIGDPNPDLWIDYEDLVWAIPGSAHSWIVLKQIGMGAPDNNFQMLIDCRYASNTTENIEILVAQKNGFTGVGTITNRPTATDEQQILAGNWGASSVNYTHGINVLKTSDGSCTRVVNTYNGAVYKTWFFDTPKNPISWWANPYLASIITGPSVALLINAANFKTRIDGMNVNLCLSGEVSINELLTEDSLFQAPDYNGEWLIMPMGVVSCEVLRKGRIGEVFDLWWIPVNWPTGLYLSGSGDRDFVSIYNALFAWTGDKLLIA